MEMSELENLEPTLKSSNSTKNLLWLLPVPILVACTLSFCIIIAGLIFWRTRSEPVEESSPISDLPSLNRQTEESSSITDPPTQNRIGDRLAYILPTPTPPLPHAAPAFICPVETITTSPTFTAPLLSHISFATYQDANGWPLDTSPQFTTTITKVLATFSYAGLTNGLVWERVWYFGDQEISRVSNVWDAGSTPGKLTVQVVVGQGGFVPGVYKLEIYIQGQLLSQSTFYILKAGMPTQRPIQIAYTTWDSPTHQLNLLDLTSRQTETLITSARGPTWSPDAEELIFYGEPSYEGGVGLYKLNMDQRKIYPLTQETFFQTIAWSPARTYLASAIAETPGSRLVLWDLEQSKAYPGPFGEDPAWSPEGQRLAYRGCVKDGWTISTIQVISSTFNPDSIQRLTQGDDRQPAWSWDGQRIAFVRREGANQDVYVMAADGSNLTRLTDNPTADVSPAWTPDHRLVFRSWRNKQWGIYIMNADGSNQRQLITTPTQADWQPDRLVVSTNILVASPESFKPQPQMPAGHGLLVISNQKNNDEMTFTIDNKEHKIFPYQVKMLPLKPGHYTWTASWPGKNSHTGIADIVLGQIAYPVTER